MTAPWPVSAEAGVEELAQIASRLAAIAEAQSENEPGRRARGIAEARERHEWARRIRARRAEIERTLRGVRPDRLQESDDLVEPVDDCAGVHCRVRSVAGRAADLINELVELLGVHESSFPVVADTSTVEESSPGQCFPH